MIICTKHEEELDLEMRRWGLTPLIPRTKWEAVGVDFNPEDILRTSIAAKATREVTDFLYGRKCPLCLIKDREFLSNAAKHLAVTAANIIGKH